MRKSLSHAFTLIELLVVISIIGLLSSVVLAAVNGARQKGAIGAGQTFDGHTYAAFFDDLVLSWNFDLDTSSPVKDLSGNGNSLLYTGGAGFDSTINPFRNGKSFYVDPNSPLIPGNAFTTLLNKPPTTDFTVSFWLNITNVGATVYISNSYGISSGTWRVGPHQSTNEIYFDFNSTGGIVNILGPALSINTWYHIAAVCGNKKAGIYVNGKLYASTSLPSGASCSYLNTSGHNISIKGEGANQYKYYVDNVRVYNNALPL